MAILLLFNDKTSRKNQQIFAAFFMDYNYS